MRILFTGASSFTGCWFVRQLSDAGHEIACTFTRSLDEYEGLRRQRVEFATQHCEPVYECRFGDERFRQVIDGESRWDVLCHHAADVTNYKSADFDVCAALRNNTHALREVLASLAERGCAAVVLTGSIFEPGEGAGSQGLPGFSPYGLSKALTAQMFDYDCGQIGLPMRKFVIPNPFGPYEEPRFTSYLARTWLGGEVAGVRTPAYVRDNIHVSLLARAYRRFVEATRDASGPGKLNPSGYIESQGAFAHRFAEQMRRCLGVPCELDLAEQTEFDEPRIRVNTDPLDEKELGWDEPQAWDELAEYYLQQFAPSKAASSA